LGDPLSALDTTRRVCLGLAIGQKQPLTMQPLENIAQAQQESPISAATQGQGQVTWVADASGRPKRVIEKVPVSSNSAVTDASSEPENENVSNPHKSAGKPPGDPSRDGSDSQDALEQEKQMEWKKEKRRKQNREAQRRRRDRLMNQDRQKQAGSAAKNLGVKDDQQFVNGLNHLAMSYAGDLASGQLNSQMSMLQKQLSFGAGTAGGMQGWNNYHAGMQPGPGQNAHSSTIGQGDFHGHHQLYQAARRADSFNLGYNLHHLAVQNGNLSGNFWDANVGIPPVHKQGTSLPALLAPSLPPSSPHLPVHSLPPSCYSKSSSSLLCQVWIESLVCLSTLRPEHVL